MQPFDDLTGRLDYSMFVVTATDGQRRAGCLVGFATQCSIDPPRFLVCLSRANHTFSVAEAAGVLVVHPLAADQFDLARLFGESTGETVDKFAACSWRPGPSGAPVLMDCADWFAGRILGRFDAGDHVGFWLEPIEAGAGAAGAPASPLLFSAVKHLVPGHRA